MCETIGGKEQPMHRADNCMVLWPRSVKSREIGRADPGGIHVRVLVSQFPLKSAGRRRPIPHRCCGAGGVDRQSLQALASVHLGAEL